MADELSECEKAWRGSLMYVATRDSKSPAMRMNVRAAFDEGFEARASRSSELDAAELERWCYDQALSKATVRLREVLGRGARDGAFRAISDVRHSLGVSGYGNSGQARAKPVLERSSELEMAERAVVETALAFDSALDPASFDALLSGLEVACEALRAARGGK